MSENFEHLSESEFVNQAWLDFRLALAEILEMGFTLARYLPNWEFDREKVGFDLFAQAGERVDLITRDERTLWVAVVNERIEILEYQADDGKLVLPDVPSELLDYDPINVDQAAFVTARILREFWGVVHPAEMVSNHHPSLVDREKFGNDESPGSPSILDNRVAESAQQLEDWIRFTMRSDGTPAELEKTGDFRGATMDTNLVVVAVHSASLVEIWSIVADGYPEESARTIAHRLNENPSPYKFVPQGAMIRMHSTLNMKPFSARHFDASLIAHMNDTDKLWKEIPVMDFSEAITSGYEIEIPDNYFTEVKDVEYSFEPEGLKSVSQANRLAEIRLKQKEFAESRLKKAHAENKILSEKVATLTAGNNLLKRSNRLLNAELNLLRASNEHESGSNAAITEQMPESDQYLSGDKKSVRTER